MYGTRENQHAVTDTDVTPCQIAGLCVDPSEDLEYKFLDSLTVKNTETYFTTEPQRAQRKALIVSCATGAVNKAELRVLCDSVLNSY